MINPSVTHRNVQEVIRLIIVSLIDAQKGFQKLGENVKDEMLKKYFLTESLKRSEFRGQLETVLHQEGMHDIVEGGSVSGAIYRVWAGLQAVSRWLGVAVSWIERRAMALVFVLANDGNVYLNGERVDIIVDLAA